MEENKGTDISRRAFCKTLPGAAVTATVMGSSSRSRASDGDANKIRVAVVGGNFGATFWWHEHPNCVVTAVTDLIPERRQRLVASYGREESIRARGKPKTVAVRYARRRRKAATERTTSPTPIQMIVLAHL